MDLISRLKKFMEYVNVPVTKFADNCSIPRPSMTQLLKGRNKKVSDEVIVKIHNAYPTLNVSWLLFGEGDMVADVNFKMSEAQNRKFQETTEPQTIDFKAELPESASLFSFSEISSENKTEANVCVKPPTPFVSGIKAGVGANASGPSNVPRHVVNIMVFYSDNSFETFVPVGKNA